MGTGHGASEWAPVTQTAFVRASQSPAQVTRLRYDDIDVLAAMGILPYGRPPPSWRSPDAFPGSYVPDPPRY